MILIWISWSILILMGRGLFLARSKFCRSRKVVSGRVVAKMMNGETRLQDDEGRK